MNFTCLSISPIALAHPGIAVATSRAGGVGLLDVEFCRPEALARAAENLERLLALVGDRDSLGLRLRADQIASHRDLLERLKNHSHWLVLSGWELDTLKETLEALPAHQNRRLLLEVIAADDAIPQGSAQRRALSEQELQVEGIVARGSESGGWVGEDSAFILTQKLLKMQPYPVYVQGGIGLHTAAACRAVGAAGVILDDRLWLMPESAFPLEWQTLLNSLSGQETLVLGERLQAPCRILSRPRFKASAALQQLADRLEAQAEPGESSEQVWQQQAQPLIGWGPPDTHAWPIGQDVGLAARFRDRYQTTGKLVQAILNA
ncbi:MAG: 6-deoxyerythronolide-B synthase, partial [Cyanobacteriota bacterium]|nr:6-deoxyerythronolide-B synthase [Cyanobacteriota bacterium]